MVTNDAIYAQQADEFRRIVDKLEKAAKAKRLDGAALAYVDMTMSCIECHKHVRTILVAQCTEDPEPGLKETRRWNSSSRREFSSSGSHFRRGFYHASE